MNNISINNNISNFEVNFYVLLSLLLFLVGFLLSKLWFRSLFGTCYSNEKTSIQHSPMIRGLGLWYIFAISPFLFLYNECFKSSEWFLIYASVIIGFWDDKRGLSQKKKLIVLFVLWFLSELFIINQNSSVFSFFTMDSILRLLLFIFFVLFFNQIDGINGMASLTYIVLVLSLLSIFSLSVLFLNFYVTCLLMSIIYLIVNLYGKFGIQGESGSFFMGTTSYVLIVNTFTELKVLYSILFICPILLDLVITSLYLFIHGFNLFHGHRENIYQKLTSKFMTHSKVSFGFAAFQVIFSFYIMYFWNKGLQFDKIILLVIFFTLFSVCLYVIRLNLNLNKK